MNFLVLLNDFFNLFFPNTCVTCNRQLVKNEEVICLHCLYHLPRTNFHLCEDNPVAKTFWGRVPVKKATAYYYFAKGSKFRKLIHQLKYKGSTEIGIFLGEQFALELLQTEFLNDIHKIVPVPLHPAKEKKRGYNQSYFIALGMSKCAKIPLDVKTLKRITASESQTRKTRFERWRNVEEKFSLSNPENFANQHILLIDDVITTGATIESCAQAVLSVQGTKVSVASLAYAN